MRQEINHIPPKSVIRLIKNDGVPLWKDKLGKLCRVGYYSKQDGLNVVWIVDQNGNYVETVEMEDLFDWFESVSISDLDDGFYGENSAPIEPIHGYSSEWEWV